MAAPLILLAHTTLGEGLDEMLEEYNVNLTISHYWTLPFALGTSPS